MPALEEYLGQGLGLLIAIALMSFAGCALVLRLLAGARSVKAVAAKHVGMAGMLLAGTAWITFLLALRIRFPHLDPDIPWPTLLQSSAIVGAGVMLALFIVAFGRRSARNVAFAGSIISSSISCMVFASMSGLAAPAALAYDLVRVVLTMAGSSTLSAGSLWLSGRPQRGQFLAALLLASALTLLAIMSLSSILPFSEWQIATATPESIAFRPVTVVFLSELGVTLLLVLAGEGVDRQAAARIAAENDRLRQLTEGTFEALLIHRDGIVLDANSTCCELIGKPLSTIKGQTLERLLPCGDLAQAVSPVTGRAAAEEAEVTGADGATIPVEVLSQEIPYAGGRARIMALRDIRERRAAEARIRFLAQHDPLTGLPNRATFHDTMKRHLALSKRDGVPLAIFCIDLDRFKSVNDALGHRAGDLLLRKAAERIRANIREIDTVARIGGDEFVLLQTGAIQPESSASLATRLISELSHAFELDGHRITVGASIGIAMAPQDSIDADTLMQDADIALYRAKANGGGTFCYFRAGMDTLLRERREMEQDLVDSLASHAFRLAFQPLFSGQQASEIEGFEALLRWRDKRRRDVPPPQFIAIAEESRLIVPIGAWVLESACREAAGWPMPWSVAVNVSPRQLCDPGFVALVRDVLQRTTLAPKRLEIEITETVLIQDGEATLAILQSLKGLGVRIVLDDFGTGYSSLSYLQRFPFDKVKIDQSFVRNLNDSASAQAIVGAILAMSHQLHLEVTAEGVENETQLAMLHGRNCDQVQGYLLSRPIPQNELARFIGQYAGGRPVDAPTPF